MAPKLRIFLESAAPLPWDGSEAQKILRICCSAPTVGWVRSSEIYQNLLLRPYRGTTPNLKKFSESAAARLPWDGSEAQKFLRICCCAPTVG